MSREPRLFTESVCRKVWEDVHCLFVCLFEEMNEWVMGRWPLLLQRRGE